MSDDNDSNTDEHTDDDVEQTGQAQDAEVDNDDDAELDAAAWRKRHDRAAKDLRTLRDKLKESETKAAELDKIKQGEMSEKDRLATEKAELQAQIDELTVGNIRREAALAAKLPADFVEFITATNDEDAAEQAKRLAKHLTPAPPGKPDLKQGARGSTSTGTSQSRDDLIRLMAGR